MRIRMSYTDRSPQPVGQFIELGHSLGPRIGMQNPEDLLMRMPKFRPFLLQKAQTWCRGEHTNFGNRARFEAMLVPAESRHFYYRHAGLGRMPSGRSTERQGRERRLLRLGLHSLTRQFRWTLTNAGIMATIQHRKRRLSAKVLGKTRNRWQMKNGAVTRLGRSFVGG